MTAEIAVWLGVKNSGVGNVKQSQIFQQPQAVARRVFGVQIECVRVAIVIIARGTIQHVRREDTAIIHVVLVVAVVDASYYDGQTFSGG